MRFSSRKKRQPVINIVSLIDILAIVLIFLVVTTVFKKEEPLIEIEVPEHSEAKATEDEPPQLIYVSKDDEIFIGKDPITIEQLGPMLKEKVAANPEYKVALKTDKAATVGLILQIMDAAGQAGLKDLPTFAEQPEKAPAP